MAEITHPVDESASLSDIPLGVVFTLAALDLEERCVLVLVAKASLVACEHSLGV